MTVILGLGRILIVLVYLHVYGVPCVKKIMIYMIFILNNVIWYIS